MKLWVKIPNAGHGHEGRDRKSRWRHLRAAFEHASYFLFPVVI